MTTATAGAATRPSRPRKIVHLTKAERAAKGKAARAEVPRSSHAQLGAGARTA